MRRLRIFASKPKLKRGQPRRRARPIWRQPTFWSIIFLLVGTAIGLGIFVIAVFILMKERITGFLLLDVFLLLYFFYRGLLTFSRGGLLTGVLALICFSLFYTLYKKISIASFITYVGIVIVFIIRS